MEKNLIALQSSSLSHALPHSNTAQSNESEAGFSLHVAILSPAPRALLAVEEVSPDELTAVQVTSEAEAGQCEVCDVNGLLPPHPVEKREPTHTDSRPADEQPVAPVATAAHGEATNNAAAHEVLEAVISQLSGITAHIAPKQVEPGAAPDEISTALTRMKNIHSVATANTTPDVKEMAGAVPDEGREVTQPRLSGFPARAAPEQAQPVERAREIPAATTRATDLQPAVKTATTPNVKAVAEAVANGELKAAVPQPPGTPPRTVSEQFQRPIPPSAVIKMAEIPNNAPKAGDGKTTVRATSSVEPLPRYHEIAGDAAEPPKKRQALGLQPTSFASSQAKADPVIEAAIPSEDAVAPPVVSDSSGTPIAKQRADALSTSVNISNHGQSVARQVADAVVNSSRKEIEVTLSPEELGRVRITVGGTDQARHVTVWFDRPDVSDAARRHIDQLRQDLHESGLGDAQLDFRDETHRHGRNHAESIQHSDESEPQGTGVSQAAVNAGLQPPPRPIRADGRLDMRI